MAENNFLDAVKDLYPIYDRVKKCIIYAEEFDPKHEFYIAPMNELRSCLDHIFKAAAHPDDLDYELNEAREHLDRAGYDAFELLSVGLQNSIAKKLEGYSTEVLTKVFPDYYREIKPKLIEIRANIAEVRKRKKYSQKGSNEAFGSYFDLVSLLMDYNKKVDFQIPSLEDYKTRREKEDYTKTLHERKLRLKERLFNAIIVGILCAVVSGLLVYLIMSFLAKG